MRAYHTAALSRASKRPSQPRVGTCATPPLVLALRICARSAQMCIEENRDDCSLSRLSRARRYPGNRADASPQAFNRVVSPKRCGPVAREIDSLTGITIYVRRWARPPAGLGRRHRSVPPLSTQRFRASASTRVLRPAMSDPRNHEGRDQTEALKSASQEVISYLSHIAATGCPLTARSYLLTTRSYWGTSARTRWNPSQAFRWFPEGPA